MPDVTEQDPRDAYLADLQKHTDLSGPSWLKAIRETGYALFTDTPFPHRKAEAWRYTDVKPIVKTAWKSVVGRPAEVSADAVTPWLYDEPTWTQLVFVDGLFAESLSRRAHLPEGAIVTSLAHAIDSFDHIVEENLEKHLEHANAFTAMNSALLEDGLFIHVPRNTVVETPVHILWLSTGASASAAHTRGLVVLDTSAELTLIETHAALAGGPYFVNGVNEVVLRDNATLKRHKIVEEKAEGYHLATDYVTQGRDTNLTTFAITLSGKIVRNEMRVVLDGEGGNCNLHGLYLNDGERLIDNALNVRHAKSKCFSRMAYKGVLDGKSSAVFTGKVDVDRGSQKTDSNQLNNNLLLSDDATIDTKPQLEIYADDVKCTHGATIGSFPPELIFYFQSRGMSAAMAHGILTYGFASEIVDEIDVQPLHDRLDRYVFEKFSPK